MGGGSWTTSAYATYSVSRGRSVDDSGTVTTSYASAQDMYTQRGINSRMDPRQFQVRECRDSDEHPNTLPVILALDVTGSMGSAAMAVAKKLNGIVTDIGKDVKDAEFCVMAIGDTYCDDAPVQMSQFESDVRIARAFDDVWFEAGGGSNEWESYTAAWYMAAYRTDLDVWKRGGRGVLITLGDEVINPVLSLSELQGFIGGSSRMEPVQGGQLSADLSSRALYDAVRDKYDVYHVCVDHFHGEKDKYLGKCRESFAEVIGDDHAFVSTVDELPQLISRIVRDHAASLPDATVSPEASSTKVDENGDIDW